MNRRHLNKLDMYKTVYAYLIKEQLTIAKLPAFTAAMSSLADFILQIENTAKTIDTAVSGKYKNKYDAEDDLIEVLMPIKAAIAVLGEDNNQNELIASASISETDLRRLNDNDLMKKAKEIADIALSNLASLTDFNVTQAEVTLLNEKVTAFGSAYSEARSGVPQRAGAGSTLHKLFDDTDDLLKKKMDHYAVILKSGNAEFYNGYLTARVIHDIGGSRGGNSGDAPPAQ